MTSRVSIRESQEINIFQNIQFELVPNHAKILSVFIAIQWLPYEREKSDSWTCKLTYLIPALNFALHNIR